jgi:toxin FitB
VGLKYLFDTNIFIDFFSDKLQDRQIFETAFLNANELLISPIVRMELFSHPNVSSEDEKIFSDLLNNFRIIPIDPEVENKAIFLRRKYKLKLPDAIIAATSIVEDAILVIGDIKDFKKVVELNVY